MLVVIVLYSKVFVRYYTIDFCAALAQILTRAQNWVSQSERSAVQLYFCARVAPVNIQLVVPLRLHC